MGSVTVLAARMVATQALARRALARWEARAQAIPDPEARRQALGSLRHKAFHSLGAAVYAAAVPGPHFARMVEFCVAYQTLSDYLDSLVDRGRPLDGRHRRRLHQAMVVALQGGAPAHGLAEAPWDDGGYLVRLVATCQRVLAAMGVDEASRAPARHLALAYARMQARKHAQPGNRRRLTARWATRLGQAAGRLPPAAGMAWWEIAAAAGSTLGIFALVAAGSRRLPAEDLEATLTAYFPWIQAWHILLDYAIDEAEDREGGELNFAACYPRPPVALERLAGVFRRAREAALVLWEPSFHRLVVAGMGALYLTDPKAAHLGALLERLQVMEPWVAVLRPILRWWHVRHPAPAQVAALHPVRPPTPARARPGTARPRAAGAVALADETAGSNPSG